MRSWASTWPVSPGSPPGPPAAGSGSARCAPAPARGRPVLASPGDVTLRVSRGVDVLDRLDPAWWRSDVRGAINLPALRMEDPARCVLGQRYSALAGPIETDPYRRCNAYLTGLRFLGLHPGEAAGYGLTGVDADLLTSRWREVIAGRRASLGRPACAPVARPGHQG